MKTLVTITASIFLFLNLNGQSSFDSIFEEFEGEKDFTSVLITKRMFTLFAQATDITIEDQNLDEIIEGLHGIKILTYEGKDANIKNYFVKKTKSTLANTNFEDLMRIKEEDEDVRIMVKEKDNAIHELILFVSDKEEATLISLSGIIDLEKISKLSKSLNIEGLEHLDNIN